MYFTSVEAASELPPSPTTSKFGSFGRKMGSKSRPPPLSLKSYDASSAPGTPALSIPASSPTFSIPSDDAISSSTASLSFPVTPPAIPAVNPASRLKSMRSQSHLGDALNRSGSGANKESRPRPRSRSISAYAAMTRSVSPLHSSPTIVASPLSSLGNTIPSKPHDKESWASKLSAKLRPKRSVPNLRSTNNASNVPPLPISRPATPSLSTPPISTTYGPACVSASSPALSASALPLPKPLPSMTLKSSPSIPFSPLPVESDPFAAPGSPSASPMSSHFPVSPSRSNSVRLRTLSHTSQNKSEMAAGGGLMSPRLSPSMLDLALEARGLIQQQPSQSKHPKDVSATSSNGDLEKPSQPWIAGELPAMPKGPNKIILPSSAPTSPRLPSIDQSSLHFHSNASSSSVDSRTPSRPANERRSSSQSSSRQDHHNPPLTPPPTAPLPPLPIAPLGSPRQLPAQLSAAIDLEDVSARIGQRGDGGDRDGPGRGRGLSRNNSTREGPPPPPGPNRRPSTTDLNGTNKGNNNGGDGRRSRTHSNASSTSSSSSSSSSSSDSEGEGEGPQEHLDDSDDDVPLAVSHPAALTVQKSLRHSRKKEKYERRLREKGDRRVEQSTSSRERQQRPRQQSGGWLPNAITGQSSAIGQGGEGWILPEELEKKLMAHLNEAGSVRAPNGAGETIMRSRTTSGGASKSRGEVPNFNGPIPEVPLHRPMEKSRTLPPAQPLPPRSHPHQSSSDHPPSSGTLSRNRSLRDRSHPPISLQNAQHPPLPAQTSSHPQSSMRRRPSEPNQIPSSQQPPSMRRRPSEGNQPSSSSSRPGTSSASRGPPQPHFHSANSKTPSPSTVHIAPLGSTNFPVPPPASLSRPGPPSRRPSLANLLTAPSASGDGSIPKRPSPPRSPTSASSPLHSIRMFLEKMGGRAIEVEIGPHTTAGMVLSLLKTSGDLPARSGEEMMLGGWAVWEGGTDWGIERPLREFEHLSAVSSSWNTETLLNAFIIKRCKISSLLSVSNVPGSPPNSIGWVQHESKKGKWSKLFMEIRDGAVWLCKNDRGKDETFLCSLSAYDVYIMTRPYKAPRTRTWTIKSQDKIQLFENPTDYIHVFSSDDKVWDSLWRGIVQARSHQLTAQNPALLRSPNPNGVSSPTLLVSPGPALVDLAQFGGGSPHVHSITTSSEKEVKEKGLWSKGSLLSKIGQS